LRLAKAAGTTADRATFLLTRLPRQTNEYLKHYFYELRLNLMYY
jgi:hypothetical protein